VALEMMAGGGRAPGRRLAHYPWHVALLVLSIAALGVWNLASASRSAHAPVWISQLWFMGAGVLLAAAVRFLQGTTAGRPDRQLQAALLSMAGGTLYRIDVFLVAYDPGNGWVYFPSVGEILITLGLIATETVVYVLVVRRFPILAGISTPAQRAVPVGL